ncbi:MULTISPECIES: RDD family protein [Thermomonospora]|uniref:RDD domain containing protein n=1 Tax=Thermomonospora curvata (strain ATCC 19995 / DSM 43183 / JCM 3096 / KCTC 9072 / NBRC 15933 / NCIMB 10081 / Henssen B9) TaxID=471852 RepID=D1A7Q8_THECD|nr:MULTISPECIES: RDD family protein [Thermomonospora]ACY96647.1 RDD domain containing protein [Thermomonospora curvata DSM 43183]PKK15446.1 MAG: RDD family protein [Thermomonospora sp. CIF 1]
MTQPPQGPSPGDRFWKPPQDQPPGPYGGGGWPPPYGGHYPGHPGSPWEYRDPAAGLAGRWARLGAALIDLILLAAVIGLVTFPFIDYGRVFRTPGGETGYLPTGQWVANFLSIVIAFLYYWLTTYKWGRTLGKQVLGIQVVRAADGGPVTQGQAAGRAAFFTVLGGLCGCIGFLDVAWILWDDRRQALHDKVAQTVVRKIEPGAPDPYAGR